MSIEENVRQYAAWRRGAASQPISIELGRSALQLSVVIGPEEGRTLRFEGECVIGRAESATLRLSDRGVAPLHARVRKAADDQLLLEDLGSESGTLLNGEPIKQAPLMPGARIQVGPRCLLLFSLEDELQRSLTQAKKVEVIGRLSAGLNHEINNLLCVVLANAAYLLKLPKDLALADADVRDCLEDIRSAAQSGSELTNRLSTLAQTTHMQSQSVDLSLLCEETLGVLRGTFPKAIRLVGSVEPSVHVRGVRAHLRQMLLNPCVNARDAMPDGGTLTLELSVKRREEFEAAPLILADSYAVLTFTDTGRGIPEPVIATAFEPFFTTKELELGKGLGLTTVRKIASDHGGCVELTSRVGAGTTLHVVLPITADGDPSFIDQVEAEARPSSPREPRVASRPPDQDSERPKVPATAASRLHVLLAEKDDALGRAFARCLRRDGYDVTWIPEAIDAPRVFANAGGNFDLVLLDIDVSEAALRQLVAELRMESVEVPLVWFASDGRAPDPSAQSTLETMVHKPVEPAMLSRIIASALRRAGHSI